MADSGAEPVCNVAQPPLMSRVLALVCQNASLALMFSRVSSTGYGTVSALWNLAYDAGLGVGAAGFGAIAAQTSFPIAFACTAVLMLAVLGPAAHDRAAGATSLEV